MEFGFNIFFNVPLAVVKIKHVNKFIWNMPEIFANINKRISSLIGEYYTKNIISYNIVSRW
jgi:hypothetical protein